MEVDTNELLHRIGSVLRGISDKLDRLVELATDHFVGASKMVADEPAKEPPEPEYREPVLPADAGEQCEFSRDGKEWCKFLLAGWQVDNNPWICERYHCWPYARIKKES